MCCGSASAPATAARRRGAAPLAIGCLLWLSAAAAVAQSITGTATFRERMQVPANAVFEASLEDISRAGAPAVLLGRTRIESPGSPPIRFEIPYDGTAIRAAGRYAVRARVTVEGRLVLTTDRIHPVLGPGQGSRVELILRATGQAPAPAAR